MPVAGPEQVAARAQAERPVAARVVQAPVAPRVAVQVVAWVQAERPVEPGSAALAVAGVLVQVPAAERQAATVLGAGLAAPCAGYEKYVLLRYFLA